ncbi:hypothetical protein IPG41_04030 [Candidatus Peregrinibacteria bacterium]|nr:MAG: hypothetical protein IPG41_04030 [Candidatus Peregrinibacteria bacterium]
MTNPLEGQLIQAFELAQKSVETFEMEVLAAQQETKGKVHKTLTASELHDAAVHKKAFAAWHVMELANQHFMLGLQFEAVQAVNRTFPGMRIGAVDIVEVINRFAHEAHLVTLKTGWSFGDVCVNFACSPEVQADMVQIAEPQGNEDAMGKLFEEIAEKMRKKKLKSTKALVHFLLGKFGTFYAAAHIAQAYGRAQAQGAEA